MRPARVLAAAAAAKLAASSRPCGERAGGAQVPAEPELARAPPTLISSLGSVPPDLPLPALYHSFPGQKSRLSVLNLPFSAFHLKPNSP